MSTEFENLTLEFFTKNENLQLIMPFPISVGFGTSQKIHKFDLGSENPQIIIECKSHTWTKSGNIPSAKMSVWNEAMLYFAVAPLTYRKILVVKKSVLDSQSLANYYIKTHGHLIPPGVEIWEFDDDELTGIRLFPILEGKGPVGTSIPVRHNGVKSKTVSKKKPGSVGDFKTKIEYLFGKAQREGRKTIRVQAGDLHEFVLGSRSTPNRMPSCCDAMYWAFDSEDRIIYQPPKGKGANLEIEYKLPR